jgi:hypothetical protein
MSEVMTYADQLRAARIVMGHSQRDAAESVELSKRTWQRWELASKPKIPRGLNRKAADRYLATAEEVVTRSSYAGGSR